MAKGFNAFMEKFAPKQTKSPEEMTWGELDKMFEKALNNFAQEQRKNCANAFDVLGKVSKNRRNILKAQQPEY